MDILEKIINGKLLSEEEVKALVTGESGINDIRFADEKELDTDRWSQSIQTILSYNGHYYALGWERGLTELQENYYGSQKAMEVKQVKKTIIVREWKEIEK